MIELSRESLDHHAFLQSFRAEEAFRIMFEQYKKNYELPALPASDYAGQLSMEEALPEKTGRTD
jgi:hypothetical protein